MEHLACSSEHNLLCMIRSCASVGQPHCSFSSSLDSLSFRLELSRAIFFEWKSEEFMDFVAPYLEHDRRNCFLDGH